MSDSFSKAKAIDDLWILIKQGDERAFEDLFGQLYPHLLKFANRILGNISDAEEAVQDAFINIWDNRTRIVVTGFVKSYLYQSVHNIAINRLQHYRTQKFQPNKSSHPDLWQQIHDTFVVDDALIQLMEAEETGLLIRKAVDDLPEKCKEVFLLSRYQDYTNEEIANKLQLSQNTVRVQIFRALEQLKDTLTEIL